MAAGGVMILLKSQSETSLGISGGTVLEKHSVEYFRTCTMTLARRLLTAATVPYQPMPQSSTLVLSGWFAVEAGGYWKTLPHQGLNKY